MRISFAKPFADALAAWRRDGGMLLPLAGLTLFLPQYAVQLLVPRMPEMPADGGGEAAVRAWAEAVSAWTGTYGLGYLAAWLAALFGGLAVKALYLDPDRLALGRALARAARLLPRYLLATMLVSLPMGVLLSTALAVPVLMALLLAPIFYIFGRTMLMGPVIVAEAPVGAAAAIARSWRMTTGHGWVLAAIYAAAMLAPALIARAVLAIGEPSGAAANPVIVAITAGIAALLAAAGALTLALAEVSVYRRLASSGT